MRRLFAASLILFVAAFALMAVSIASGEGQIGLFLIFPFIVAWGPFAVAGAVLMLLAIFCGFFGIWRYSEPLPEGDVEGAQEGGPQRSFGGVVMIGPIPIAFGSGGRIAKQMMWAGIALFIIMLIIFLVLVHPFF